MTEKAARIAELEREVARLESYEPTFIGKQNLALYRAELARLRNEPPALTQGEGSEPVGWDLATLHDLAVKEYKTACEVYSSDHETALLTVVDEIIYRLRGSASPPPLPAGNADPRVREALEFGFASYQDGSFELIARTAEGNEVTLKGKLEGQQLEQIDKIFPTCVFVKYGIDPLPSPQSQGLVDAAEWRSMENAPRKDGMRILINTGDYIGVYRYSSGNEIYDFKTWQPEGNERHGHIFANDYGERGCKWLPLDLPAALRSRASDRSA